ncbi:MAG: peptidase U32 family protein [Gammaproteobacteria bacterium]
MAQAVPSSAATAQPMRLVCPAGTPPALRIAVDCGADDVYLGFRDETNARNFAGLNFDDRAIREGIAYAHARGARVLVALNTFPQPRTWRKWQAAVDRAAMLGADAIIVADAGLMAYAARTHPELRLHLSVQGSATSHEAINFYHERFGVRRAVLPRVLSIEQIEKAIARTPVEIEVFGFGSLSIMVEGRCALSSWATGESPNTHGGCSPAKAVRWQQGPDALESRLGGVLIDRFGAQDHPGYPTLCRGRFVVDDELYYPFEEPTSLNTLGLLPRLQAMGVKAVKIEGRQRSPAYVETVTRVWREALDDCAREPQRFRVRPAWQQALADVSEGLQCTLGAYHRPWK